MNHSSSEYEALAKDAVFEATGKGLTASDRTDLLDMAQIFSTLAVAAATYAMAIETQEANEIQRLRLRAGA